MPKLFKSLAEAKSAQWPKFDHLFKALFQDGRFVEDVLQLPSGVPLDSELPSGERVDLLRSLAPGAILHIEFQAKDLDHMEWRMLHYYWQISSLPSHESPYPKVMQYVLFVGNGSHSMLPGVSHPPGLRFNYTLANITDFQEETTGFLASGNLTQRILGLVCKGVVDNDDWYAVVEEIARLRPINSARKMYSYFLTAAVLRDVDDDLADWIDKMALEINAEESRVFKRREEVGRLEEAIYTALQSVRRNNDDADIDSLKSHLSLLDLAAIREVNEQLCLQVSVRSILGYDAVP